MVETVLVGDKINGVNIGVFAEPEMKKQFTAKFGKFTVS